jgi:aminocarboxymuconate-semialdehyde decarboxylase
LVLVHPTFPPNGPAGDRGEFLSVGYLGETAMAATKLVLAGILEECPDARIVWSHCGGSLCMLVDRIDRGYKRYEKCLRPPSEYLRGCYYDTACMHGPALDCARATFGGDRLVYGTDEPHVPNATKGVLAALRERAWPISELAAVLSGNARRLLG